MSFFRRTSVTVDELVAVLGAESGLATRPGAPWLRKQAQRAVQLADGDTHALGAAADRLLFVALDRTWPRGWQPVDLWQLCRRQLSAAATELLVGALAADAARYATAALHPRWRAQLTELGAEVWWDRAEPYCTAYAARAGELQTALEAVLDLQAQLRLLPPEPLLLPPPGTQTADPDDAPSSAAEVDPKILARIRALLAKAESTDFPDEADAFFAKAQELMSRYSLERAALDGEPAASTVAGRRIWLDNPYLNPKSMLVTVVAKANRCRAVFRPGLGFATVVGEPTDTELVEVLTTSLLVQAGRAMLAAGSRTDRRGTSRTKSFRQSFLVSYAHRIGERLAEVAQQTETDVAAELGDGRLLPVLAARERAVEQRMTEYFPLVVTRAVNTSNPAGWTAGRAAADLANLNIRPVVR